MDNNGSVDYYEVLQVSPNAEPDTIQRVYRLLAQRYHPDNQETGSGDRFRSIHEAYSVLSDPERRVQFDVAQRKQQQDRWRLVSAGASVDSDRASEQAVRLTVLEILCARRRVEPTKPGLFPAELEKLAGVPQEHLEFTIWYLIQKKLVQRSDASHLVITVDGVDYLEQNLATTPAPRRLRAAGER